MSVTITQEHPGSPEAIALIDELEEVLAPSYPAESRHGYSVEKLIAQGVALFVLRDGGVPAGCGGVQLFGMEYGELKRMYVRPAFRGRGYAKLLLEHLAAYTMERGVNTLRLETGIHQHEAVALYESWGFRRIAPFPPYTDDPLSIYMERRIG